MTAIDPTARVAPGAVIGKDVTIGPYCVIGPNVVIGDGCRLISHVHVTGHTTIGAAHRDLSRSPRSARRRNRSSIAAGRPGSSIGADCDIRESVTMNTGTEDDGGVTAGRRPLLLHGRLACRARLHGRQQRDLANNAVLGGHVTVEDYVFFGGHSAVHQFVRIGESAMIAGVTGVGADVIPFGFAIGQRGDLDGLNVVGMRRRGYSRADIHAPAAGLSQPVPGARAISRIASRQVARDFGVRSGGGEDRRLHPRRRIATADEGVADRQQTAKAPRRTARRHERSWPAGRDSGPLAIICGGGSFPFAVADALDPQGPARGPVPAARLGRCRSGRTLSASLGAHLGQFGCFVRIARKEGCRDVIFIGTLVRPGHPQLIAFDLDDAAVAAADRPSVLWRRRSSAVRRRPHVRGARVSACSGRMRSRRKFWCRKARSAAMRPSARDEPISRAASRSCARSGRSISGRRSWSPTITCSRSKRPKAPTRCWRASPNLRRNGRIRIARRRRRAGQGAEAGTGPPLRSAVDRAAHHRRRRARGPCRASRSSPAARLSLSRERIVRSRRPAGHCSSSGIGGGSDMKVFLVAAEESGDRLGAALMPRAESDARPERSNFRGVGGHEMAAEGMPSLFRIDDLAIVGFAAIPRRLPMILRRIRQTARAAIAARPDVLVIIDSPDFTHRVARRVRRARSVDSDRRLCLALGLGLAAGARARHAALCRPRAGAAAVRAGACTRKLGGPPCTYVGHPLVEQIDELAPERGGGAPPQMPTRRSCWCCPAAAESEIKRLLPSRSSARSSASPKMSGRSTSSSRRPPHLADAVIARNRGLAAAAEDRGEARGPARGVPARARGARQIRARSRSNLRCRACRWSPPTRCRGFEAAIARRLIRRAVDRSSPISCSARTWCRNSSRQDCTPREAVGMRCCRCCATAPSAGAQVEAFAQLDAIMEIGKAEPARRAAEIVLAKPRASASRRSCIF